MCHARLCQTHRFWNCKKAGPGLPPSQFASLKRHLGKAFCKPCHGLWDMKIDFLHGNLVFGTLCFRMVGPSPVSAVLTTWLQRRDQMSGASESLERKHASCCQAILSRREGYGTEATPTDIPRCQVHLIGCTP